MKSETTVGMLVLGGAALFLYMGLNIGSFTFDSADYHRYTMTFKDVSGLSRKAEVKIAGVKVGWVEELELLPNSTMHAQAHIKIRKDFKLYHDAYALVRQDGLLGPKYIEIAVGSPTLATIPSGGALGQPSEAPVSMDELMHKFKSIATNVESITSSFKDVVGGAQGEENLHAIFNNLQTVSMSLANFSVALDNSFSRNENGLDSILQIGDQIRRIADRLDNHVLPAFQDGVQKISDCVTTQVSSTALALEDASVQVRDGFSSINSISHKIDSGQGFIGKLINEEDTYNDLKVAIQGIKSYVGTLNAMQVVFDMHGESMQRPAYGWRHEDSKFFVDMKVYPSEDYFYLVQLASSERGYKEEIQNLRDYSTIEDKEVNTDALFLRDRDRLEFTYNRTDTFWRRNQVRFGVQFGKIFNNIAFRIGLIEGFGGAGIDFDIPFATENFRWVTSLEMYDLTGWNHRSKRYSNVIIDDRRPHVKWINRMYLFNNIYMVFGADDFASKKNANAFIGAGIRFGDDNIKYLFPTFGSSKGMGGQS